MILFSFSIDRLFQEWEYSHYLSLYKLISVDWRDLRSSREVNRSLPYPLEYTPEPDHFSNCLKILVGTQMCNAARPGTIIVRWSIGVIAQTWSSRNLSDEFILSTIQMRPPFDKKVRSPLDFGAQKCYY